MESYFKNEVLKNFNIWLVDNEPWILQELLKRLGGGGLL